jgi:hypothetical protein
MRMVRMVITITEPRLADLSGMQRWAVKMPG